MTGGPGLGAMSGARLLFSLLALVLAGCVKAGADTPGYLERAACGWVNETVGFFVLRSAAGDPRLERPPDVAGLEEVHLRTKDGRVLGGYVVRASRPTNAGAPGYVLVVQGNAMLAEQTVDLLRFLADAGLDAYAYDFRGYGISAGRSRFAAILSDYTEIIHHLNNQGYDRALLYGASLGGVIILHAIGAGVRYDAAVVDSVPSRITDYGCPDALNPVHDVPEDSSRIMIIVGGRDTVVPPEVSRELARLIRQRNGTLVEREDFAHPFGDAEPAVARDRRRLLLRFLVGAPGAGIVPQERGRGASPRARRQPRPVAATGGDLRMRFEGA